MRNLLLLLLSLAFTGSAMAVPAFTEGTKYHIVCMQFASGCVADGASCGQSTPLYHLAESVTDDSAYWLFTSEGNGAFSIKNAKTGKYVTYDGVRQDSPQLRRYVSMTDAKDGYNSLWTFALYGDGVYAIRNAQNPDHLWDVRVDSYCVGTYSNTSAPNSNQQFCIVGEDGEVVTEKQSEEPPVDSPDGFDVSSWLDATEESADGWTFDSEPWSMPGFGDYVNGTASVVLPFLERWTDSAYGSLADDAMRQTLSNLPAGKYQLAADIIAVRQASKPWGGGMTVGEETGRGVWLYANGESVETGTRNERPEHFAVDFTLTAGEALDLGVLISQTNANWVAADNFRLYFLGTEEELLEGEKAKIRSELLDYYDSATLELMIYDCHDNFDALEELRHGADNMPLVDPLQHGLRNLTIGGQSLAWVESLGLYMASLGEEHFGTDYTAVIDYTVADGWDSLKINGRVVAPGDSYTFAKVAARKNYTFGVSKSDGSEKYTNRLTFTALPVVRIYGSFDNSYQEGRIQVLEPDMGYAAELLNMKAKWRGGITNSNGKHKRNYHVKLKDGVGNKLEKKFFGLRNDNSWILESCQVDMSRIRNRVLTDLWNDYSTPPYYKDQEPKAMTGSRGQFVELILNDEYRGIYCMTENMDRKQMKLKKADETADGAIETVHGQLWKSKDWTFATLMGTSPDGGYWPKYELTQPNEYSEMWDQYQVKYPDIEDSGWLTDWSTLYDAVQFVCYADDDTFREHVADFFDLPVVTDYYILMETVLATDNHGKNMFFACYDKQADPKITFGVWDMDATLGQRWSDDYYHWGGMRPEQDYCTYIQNNEHGYYNLFKRLRETDADDFNMKVRLRYRDLRKNHLATDSILERFRTYISTFKTCGAAQREYARWNGDSDIAGLSLNFDTEMDYLTDWITRRMNYLDTTRFDIASLPDEKQTDGDVNGDGVVDVADISAIVSVMAGEEQQLAETADVNGDGTVNVADISNVISIMAGN